MPAPSYQDYFDLARAEAIVKRPDLAVAEGDISEMFVAGGAAMVDRFTGYAIERIAATYLDGAEGDDLTVLADDHFDVQRRAAVKSVGVVTLSLSVGIYTGTIAAGFRVATTPDADGNFVEIVTTADAIFVGESSKSVAAEAVNGGTDGNVAAAAVNRLLDTPPAGSWSVTNAALFAGGAEEESDDELKDRVRGVNATRPRGTLAAIEVGALQVPTVKVVSVVEDPTTLLVTVYVADADGNSNATMTAAVTTELEDWRCAGASVSVVGGTLYAQAIDISLTVRTGVDVAALSLAVRTAIVNAVNRLKPGETLYRDLISSAARAVDPDGITTVTVNTPAADVAPSSGQTIRADVSTTSIT